MADGKELDWQSEKTTHERNRYMLDNEIATDVCFEVGLPDSPSELIRAHKYMLISRSTVFQTMFTSGFQESTMTTPIRVDDIQSDIFRHLLSFIYFDQVKATFDKTLDLMYAAKKYMITGLTKYCSEYLQEKLNEENVCNILNTSIVFDDDKLGKACLQFIGNLAESVFKRKEFNELSREALKAVLALDRVTTSELSIFHSCIIWAEHRLDREVVEKPTSEQIREILGEIFYGIRFPTMEPQAFADFFVDNDILTASEKLSIYHYMLTKKTTPALQFSTIDRSEYVLYTKMESSRDVKYNTAWRIEFQVDCSVLITAIGIRVGEILCSLHVEVHINRERVGSHNSSNCQYVMTKYVLPETKNMRVHKLSFKRPVAIERNVLYKIKITSNDVNTSYNDDFKTSPHFVPLPNNINFNIYKPKFSQGVVYSRSLEPISEIYCMKE